MALERQPAHSDQVLALLGGLRTVDAAGPIMADTELDSIGFDSLAGAEFAAAAERDLGIDLVECRLAGLRTAGDVAVLVEETARAERRSRERYPRGMGRFQRPASAILGPLCRWWFSLEVTGTGNIPSRGPAILCMNHESLLDIPLVVVALPRPARFMAKRELFAKPRMARFFHELGGFSVDRLEFDLRAIEIALEIIRRGEVLGMYPEGTRTPDRLLPFREGAAWLALKTGTPLVPAALVGTGSAMPTGSRFFKRVSIRISLAPPIEVEVVEDPVERRKRAKDLTQELREAVESMWEPSGAGR
ncbi:MAG: lysophospholipid acyltransferase family protein [Actinomycetota bacterium]